MDPFTIDVPVADLVDLRSRIERSRFVAPSSPEPWGAGADPDYLRGLMDEWVDTDLSDLIGRPARYPQFTATVRGRRLHFVHVEAVGGSGLAPVILAHGWPSCFVEMLPLADRLTDPARFGGRAEDARSVVIPSLPGFLWSELPDEPLTRRSIAETLHALMTETLGYGRYAAFGGDIGGAAIAWMAALHPDAVVGFHLIHPPFPTEFAEPITAAEQAFLDVEAAYDETDAGYSWMMSTRPDTAAAALADSPVGLAAWIVDKLRAWADHEGDLESVIDRETILSLLTLYWVTGCIGTSFRQYLDYPHNAPRPTIDVPAAFLLSRKPGMTGFPRSIADRSCSDIRSWHVTDRGGHFLALEQPDSVAGSITAFLRDL
jgi:pimeloyl-ACP methyl ester carboxylesterase